MYRIFIIEDDPGSPGGSRNRWSPGTWKPGAPQILKRSWRNFLTITLIWSCWIFLCLLQWLLLVPGDPEDFQGAGDLYLFRLR